MEVITDLASFTPVERHYVAAIGTFDGLHIGHRSVIAQAKAIATRLGLGTMVFTFRNHPLVSLGRRQAPPLLLAEEDKISLYAQLGVDSLVNIPFTTSFATLTALDFLTLLSKLGVRHIVVGEDFTCGRGGKGTTALLPSLAKKIGLTATIVPLVKAQGAVVSSSHIRTLIAQGAVDKARRLLGRPYCLVGTVVKGEQRGRLLGYPTANIDLRHSPYVLPANGAYAACVSVAGRTYMSMLSCGHNPTFAEDTYTLEAYLLNFAGDLYGKRLCVGFYAYLRPEQKFPSVQELKSQLARDKAKILEIFTKGIAFTN